MTTLVLAILELESMKRRLNVALKRLGSAKQLGTNEGRASKIATLEVSTSVSVIIPDHWNITRDRLKLAKKSGTSEGRLKTMTSLAMFTSVLVSRRKPLNFMKKQLC